jgi:hypothetical protein
MTVAALYVDARGPYATMPDVEAWDLERDARNYAGPYPVVAHPPCTAWCQLSHLSRGGGADCGPIAVDQVRLCGGVLEQPAYSKLWRHCGLPDPWYTDAHGGYMVEVEQVSWGHVARKRTWLYFVDVPWEAVKRTLQRGGVVTYWCSGGGTGSGKTPPGIKVCSATQRNRTPIAFAHWLVSLAETVNVSETAVRYG